MNPATKILFGTLFAAVALAVGNVIAKQSFSDSPSEVLPSHECVDSLAVAPSGDLRHTVVRQGTPLAASVSDFITLERAGYILCYNPSTRLPVWVAWHLPAAHTDGAYSRKGLKFAEDEDVPAPRATNMDYMNSGYDRGHICPSSDNRWSEEAQIQSFLYTNCCPQLHNLNAGDWGELEKRCRLWAQRYGDIYIVSGPLLFNKKHKTIGRNKVVVPEAFYKVVLCLRGTPKAIGFIYRNEANNKRMSSYVNTVDDVERLTGLDFFSALSDDVEQCVEAVANLNDWE